jgi:hypothetical protein
MMVLALSNFKEAEHYNRPKDPIQALSWLYAASELGVNEAYEEMKPIKDLLTSEGVEKAKELANEIVSGVHNCTQTNNVQ